MDKPALRTKSGTFAPGVSGNPGGRARNTHRVRDLARTYTEVAVEALVAALGATTLLGRGMIEVPDHGTRINAAQALLDRGWGKPASSDIVDKQDDPDTSAAGLTDAELLQEAINRAKAIS